MPINNGFPGSAAALIYVVVLLHHDWEIHHKPVMYLYTACAARLLFQITNAELKFYQIEPNEII